MTEADGAILVRMLDTSERLTELVLEAVKLMKEMAETIQQVNQRMTEIETRGAKDDQETDSG